MAGATAKVQQACAALPGKLCLQQGKFTALGMHGAAQVSAGLLAELALDDVLMGGAGHLHLLGPYRWQASSHTG
ncbi:hypothetical protein D3C84_1130500 [compost metagenome]